MSDVPVLPDEDDEDALPMLMDSPQCVAFGIFVIWYVIQGTEYRVQDTEYRVQGTEYRVQSTEHRLQGTGYRVQVVSIVNLLKSCFQR